MTDEKYNSKLQTISFSHFCNASNHIWSGHVGNAQWAAQISNTLIYNGET
jgi:hypothetical protein